MDMDRIEKRASAAADLTDDLIVEILSGLPVTSICRFKCVSRHWYGLITGPEHRRRLPQTISGFFYRRYKLNQEGDGHLSFPDFLSILGGILGGDEQLFPSDPSLPFLTGYRVIIPEDCCNGLILCLCWKVYPRGEADYVVCNPATAEWFVLPESVHDKNAKTYRLGFDPAVSTHFHVFQILEDEDDVDYGYVVGINIYSSETGGWSHKENGWGNDEIQIVNSTKGVFLSGILHLLTYEFQILAVDTQGNAWRTIPLLKSMCVANLRDLPLAFIGQSRGRLHYINMRNNVSGNYTSKLGVWVLEDYSGNEWNLKYNINTSQLFGDKNLFFEQDYMFVSIHPDCSLIFLVWKSEDMLISYDMDRGKFSVICHLKERYDDVFSRYLPYVPFFSLIGSSE